MSFCLFTVNVLMPCGASFEGGLGLRSSCSSDISYFSGAVILISLVSGL